MDMRVNSLVSGRKLIDSHKRTMNKLRISLADKCNFRCLYCMPEDVKFIEDEKLLTREEIFQIASDLNSCGIDEIRLTGGEPTLRRDFVEIVKDLSTLKLKKLALTTNGVYLGQFLNELLNTNLKNINFSLDSLNEENFNRITRSTHFDKVYKTILRAHDMGFNVKINVVVMRGFNDHEINDFIAFSARTGIQVRFLESMKIGVMQDKYDNIFMSADEMLATIDPAVELIPLERPWSSTSFNYQSSSGAKIGFIASESKPFCNECSRLRISATGEFRPCLMSEKGINVRGMNREQLFNTLILKIEEKPMTRVEQTTSSMYQLGG